LELLWGSPFTLTKIDLCTLIILALIIIVYISCFFKQISMIFFCQ
jgi:ABC-type Mn2+/Zn2+ transport system permease subunit